MLVLAFFDTRFQKGAAQGWEKLRAARPSSRQHFSLNLPASLGFYDIADPVHVDAIIACAKGAGVDGFVIDLWRDGDHYHHDGALLTGGCNKVPNGGFGLAFRWRNGVENVFKQAARMAEWPERARQLVAQLKDMPCAAMGGRIPLIVDQPTELAQISAVVTMLRQASADAGLPGLYLLANRAEDKGRFLAAGFDALVDPGPDEWHSCHHSNRTSGLDYLEVLAGMKDSSEYLDRFFPYLTFTVSRMLNREKRGRCHPRVFAAFHDWLSHPDGGATHLMVQGRPYHSHLFGLFVENAMLFAHGHFPAGERAIFLQSWNGWLEGSQIEPSVLDGDLVLNAARNAIDRGRYMLRTRGEQPSALDAAARERIALMCDAARHSLN